MTPALKMRVKAYEDCRVGTIAKPALSACAHCGGKATTASGTTPDGHNSVCAWTEVFCTGCKSSMRTTEWDIADSVQRLSALVAMWNRRAV